MKGGRGLYALGNHLLVELRDCKPEILSDLEFNPFGISGMVVIAESHISIHTWPEHGYAAVDIFTCGDLIKPESAASFLIRELGCKNPSMVEFKRGILSHKNEKVPHKVTDSVCEPVV
jgi:S-adenosylmethionine decarboxylase